MQYKGKSGHENVLKRLGAGWTMTPEGKHGGLATFENGEFRFSGGFGTTGYFIEGLEKKGLEIAGMSNEDIIQTYCDGDAARLDAVRAEKEAEYAPVGDDSGILDLFIAYDEED